jgi:hypothetical protein
MLPGVPHVVPAVAREIERFLRTGEHDIEALAWPGSSLERMIRAEEELREALVAEVLRLARTARRQLPVPAGDLVALARRKVTPMVCGLFPKTEQPLVLETLATSVVFVTHENIEALMQEDLRSAWDLANIYLGSIQADLLGRDARRLVGLSEEKTCYVSPAYFEDQDPFGDFLVHEAAHVFHNCKRRTIGLPFTRQKEWLLDISFAKREVFAYACEAFSRILERAHSRAERLELAEVYEATYHVPDQHVETAEVARILREATAARNGWKVILALCSPPRKVAVLSARGGLPAGQRGGSFRRAGAG